MIICADDYGLSPGVSRAIRDLVTRGRVSAVSCMVHTAEAMDELKALQAFSSQLDIGLHIVLTEGVRPSFFELAQAAHLRSLNKEKIRIEIKNQILCFAENFGRLPDHLDGHQHAHQLPIIREVIVELHREMQLSSYVRVFDLPLAWSMGQAFFPQQLRICAENLAIQFQARPLIALLDRHQIPRNRYFVGHYSYRRPIAFSEVLERYVSLGIGEQDIFVCHPGYSDTDAIAEARQDCAAYLLSERFKQLDVSINRFQW